MPAPSPGGGRRPRQQRAWRRVLWEDRRDAFDDDYVDEDGFLKDLKMNALLETPGYATLVLNASGITQQGALVVLYLLAFSAVHDGRVDAVPIFGACLAGGMALSLVSWLYAAGAHRGFVATEAATTCAWLFFVSPVVRSLTLPWADDTLTAMCVMLFVLHVAAADYTNRPMGEEPIATNAAGFATVVLASRLPSTASGFAMIALSVVLFTLSPRPRKYLRARAPWAWAVLTALLVVVSITLLLPLNAHLAGAYASAVAGVTFVVPAVFRYLQAVAKLQISGPWDEAKPKNSAAAAEWANTC